MTTASIPELSAALETALQTIDGLNTSSFLKDAFSTPAAAIGIEEMEYHSTFGNGIVTHTFLVHVIVGRQSDLAATQLLDSYMAQAGADPASIQGALEADQTLGGIAAGVVCMKAGPPEALPLGSGGALYVTVPFTVLVHA